MLLNLCFILSLSFLLDYCLPRSPPRPWQKLEGKAPLLYLWGNPILKSCMPRDRTSLLTLLSCWTWAMLSKACLNVGHIFLQQKEKKTKELYVCREHSSNWSHWYKQYWDTLKFLATMVLQYCSACPLPTTYNNSILHIVLRSTIILNCKANFTTKQHKEYKIWKKSDAWIISNSRKWHNKSTTKQLHNDR